MRAALLSLVVFASLIAGCPSGPYGDAGADRPPVELRNFDVDSSGTSSCPGQLFQYASEGRATCSRAPQTCFSQESTMMRRFICECSGSDGGAGEWDCRAENP